MTPATTSTAALRRTSSGRGKWGAKQALRRISNRQGKLRPFGVL